MTMGDNQQRETPEMAAFVANRVQIQDVILSGTKALRSPGMRHALRDSDIETDVATSASVDEHRHALVVLAQFRLYASPKDNPKTRLLGIEADFVLFYLVEPMEGLTQKHFDAFADANGVFNAWPYWREYVHSLTQRMGLDGIVVPIFRISGKTPVKATSAPTTSAEEPLRKKPKTRRRADKK